MKNKSAKLALAVFLWVVSISYVNAEPITGEAQQLYQINQNHVYQIQVIDKASGKKSVIGSGFRISRDGYIATNFHVISSAIHWPDKYTIEYLKENEEVGTLQISDFDVVHDLAIVKTEEVSDTFLALGESPSSKGAKLYSLGNPHDIGMTIIEGIYNGLMEQSLYRKIHFSGSVNPGMSGGPALDSEGKVVGINVATAGNQLSFLVPVDYLKKLYENVIANELNPNKRWQRKIERQLLKNQNSYMNQLLNDEWESLAIGDVKVPGEILNVFKCWGGTQEENTKLHNYTYINCSSEDNIFVSSSHTTGKIIYRYGWITSSGLSPTRFYNLYESYFQFPYSYLNAKEEDATNFDCSNDFVNIDDRRFKVSLCSRKYKKYSKLYDVNLSMASVDKKDRGLLVEVVALGISKDKALEFVEKFMESIQWVE